VVASNVRVPEDAIRREVRLTEGQLYTETGILEAKRRISTLGLFRRVDASTRAEPDPTHWTVMFEVEE
jgi:outer membrane protein insertion porin family